MACRGSGDFVRSVVGAAQHRMRMTHRKRERGEPIPYNSLPFTLFSRVDLHDV
jgi:hypothetical protein